jgi:hypothetical protein
LYCLSVSESGEGFMSKKQSNPADELKSRWNGHEEELRNLTEIIRKKANWQDSALYKRLMKRMSPLPQDIRPAARDLRGANLQGADLVKAHLKEADLREANLRGADLSEADLQEAHLQKATLRDAVLSNANLQEASLPESDLRGANMRETDLRGANLRKANLKYAILYGANFENAAVDDVTYNRHGRYKGIRISSCYGSPRFRRFAQDQEFIEEFRGEWWRFPLYLLWLVISDCGRSLMLWLLWSVLIVLFFAMKFYFMGSEALVIPEMSWTFPTMIYYSAVNFATLGFGVIVPKTQIAAWCILFEIIMGYIMLAGLISIFVTKLARRS